MRIFCFCLALLFTSQFCWAEKSSKTAIKPKEPTLITSDGPLEVDYNKKIAFFQDNVVVTDPQGKMKADKMKVFFNGKSNEIREIVCDGNVKIFNEGRYSESEHANYYAIEKKIILTGNPVIRQDNDYYSAEKITIFAFDNRVLFEPSARLLIYPSDDSSSNMQLLGKDTSQD